MTPSDTRRTGRRQVPARVVRWLFCLPLAGWALCYGGCRGGDDAYPAKPVTIVCPWAAGGGTDRVARYWAEALQREFGRPFLVNNKTGGAGAIGHSAGAAARPDGYTLTSITFELTTMHHMGISTLTYRDFDCLLQINADPAAVVVRQDAPWKTLREFLDEVRRRPGEIKMSGTARGGAWDLARAGLLLADNQPVDAILWIPTQGSAPSLVELLGGHIDAVCCSVPEARSTQDETRVLAVMAEDRLPQNPDIPTAKESGVNWTAVGWRGLAAPKGTPPEVKERLLAACRKIAASPEYRDFLDKNSFGSEIREGAEFLAFLEQQDQQWQKVIEATGFQPAE